MGNCLVLHPKTVQIVKPDGKVLEYRESVKAHEVLSDFSGHGMLETPPLSATGSRHLPQETALKRGHSYYLVPLLPPKLDVPARKMKKKKKKKVRFADASDSELAGDGIVVSGSSAPTSTDGAVRIKLVISRRELMEMMGKGGVSTCEELMCQIITGQKLPSHQENVDRCEADGEDDCRKGWKPSLEIIHENDRSDQSA